MKKYFFTFIIYSMLTLNVTASVPQESRKCAIIRFANPGWSDVTVTTAAAAYVLQTLGYKTKEVFISVPITYLSLAAGDVDVFLGYWDPSMNQIYKPYAENKTVEILHTNLTGANYGLAVPKYLYDAGLTDIKDLAKFSHLLNNKIYGIEPGNDGNQIILSIINDKKFNINNFQLIESSEQAMLSQADLLISQKQPIVFLAWEPHPMNIRYDIKYLTGAENYFGFNNGTANVHTNARKNFATECPNVAKFLGQLTFTTEMENEWLDEVINNKNTPLKTIKNYLQKNQQLLDKWLKNVYSTKGENAKDIIKNNLNLDNGKKFK